MSVTYLQIIFIGIMGGAFFNIISGILRGMGDSVYPLIFLLVASVLNIFLDIWFVTQFQMGVAGVAWATIISQFISAILCLMRLWSMKSVLDFNRQTIRMEKNLASKLGRLGMPAGITQAIFSMSAIVVQSLTNSLGTQVIAASIVVMRVDGFCMMPNFTFGMAATTFVGQNIGARRMDRVHQGTRDALKMGFCVSSLLTLTLLLFGSNLMRMFTDTGSLIALGVRGMRILAAGYIVFAGTQILMGVMRGAGDTMKPMWISIFNTVILRVPIAYLWAWMSKSDMYPKGSPDSIFASLLITWVAGFLITTIVYRRGTWKNKSIVENREEHKLTACDN
jgi:putative MATE family efflux protein